MDEVRSDTATFVLLDLRCEFARRAVGCRAKQARLVARRFDGQDCHVGAKSRHLSLEFHYSKRFLDFARNDRKPTSSPAQLQQL